MRNCWKIPLLNFFCKHFTIFSILLSKIPFWSKVGKKRYRLIWKGPKLVVESIHNKIVNLKKASDWFESKNDSINLL